VKSEEFKLHLGIGAFAVMNSQSLTFNFSLLPFAFSLLTFAFNL
jgi:hypothetical protein